MTRSHDRGMPFGQRACPRHAPGACPLRHAL